MPDVNAELGPIDQRQDSVGVERDPVDVNGAHRPKGVAGPVIPTLQAPPRCDAAPRYRANSRPRTRRRSTSITRSRHQDVTMHHDLKQAVGLGHAAEGHQQIAAATKCNDAP